MASATSDRRFGVATVACALLFLVGCPSANDGMIQPPNGTVGADNPRDVEGACCVSDGNCERMSLDDCVVQAGGVFQGADIACDTVVCGGEDAAPTGACCLPDEEGCIDGQIESVCADFDGIYQGNDSACTDPGVQCVEDEPVIKIELETTNPDVDFDLLREGDAVTLTAPEPTDSPSARIRQLDNCTCTWSVDPSDGGVFETPDQCTTVFTVGSVSVFTIGVFVTCDDGRAGMFEQDVTISGAASFGVEAVATADPDEVDERELVTLDGSASDLPGLGPATFSWTLTDTTGPNVSIDEPTSAVTTFTAPSVPCPQNNTETLTFSLTVEQGLSSDTVSITVVVENIDFCGGTGGPTPPPCEGVVCDDGETCTTEVCVDGVCVFTNVNDGMACDDGNECTNDACNAGQCVGDSLALEESACTQDGLTCNGMEVCTAGVCVGTPEVDGTTCSDGVPCTTGDACSSGACVGNAPCQPPLTCQADGSCQGCVDDVDCPVNDGNVCTGGVATCVGGACVYPNDVPGACDDGDPCSVNDTCSAGVCVAGGPRVCDDSNTCTDDSCDAANPNADVQGCVFAGNNANTCTDTFSCTSDVCVAGVCVATPNNGACTDGLECTDDSCNPAAPGADVVGCVFVNDNNNTCSDPFSCTGDVCTNGICGSTPNDSACNDGNTCTLDTCDPADGSANAQGCVNAPLANCTTVAGQIRRGDDDGAGSGTLASGRTITVELRRVDDGSLVVSQQTSTGDYSLSVPATFFNTATDARVLVISSEDVRFEQNPAEFVLTIQQDQTNNVPNDFIAFYDFYVDDDANEPGASGLGTTLGTFNNPFPTIQEAADLVFPGDNVFVRAGTYPETLFLRRSGAANRRIFVQAFQGELATIDAANTREYCIFFGANLPGVFVDFVTVDGLTCRDFLGLTGSSAGILMLGTRNSVIRNCHIFHDPWDGLQQARGIFILGPNEDPIIEYNHVHHVFSGIEARRLTGDNPGFVERPLIRWNHVHHANMVLVADQNNSVGITVKNDTTEAIIEHNVVHHCDDANLGSDDSAGHIFRYNISYLGDHLETEGGNGAGIKTKPALLQTAKDIIVHNVSFLIATTAFEINVRPGQTGADVFHNLAYGSERGLGISTPAGPTEITNCKNNIFFGNVRDVEYSPVEDPSANDYNFVGDGRFDASGPHELSGDPLVANIGLLTIDTDGDLTPDVLQLLDDPNAFPDTESAILFAKQQIALIFGLQAGSPAVDAGVDLGLSTSCFDNAACLGSTCDTGSGFCAELTDLLGNQVFDHPVPDPWDDDADPGTFDMGPIERIVP